MPVQMLDDPLFVVETASSEEYIVAATAEDAIEGYYALWEQLMLETGEEDPDFRADNPILMVRQLTDALWTTKARPRLALVR